MKSPSLASDATGFVEDEVELIARAKEGDSRAFDALCRKHGERLLRHASGLSTGRSAAEDLVQETLIQAWLSLPRFHGGCQFFTWLCSILIHRHRSSLRKRIAIPFSWLFGDAQEKLESSVAAIPDPAPGPSQRAESGERATRLLRMLNRLPERQRAVVYLRFYADESLEGIATAVGCSLGTVKSRLFHGLERLRELDCQQDANEL